MPSKKVKVSKKKVQTKSVSHTSSSSSRETAMWKKLLISLGLSLILVAPLYAIANGTRQAVLGVATKVIQANTPLPTNPPASPNITIVK